MLLAMFISERFVLGNCFITTVLRMSFNVFDLGIAILGPTTLIFCAWGWAKLSCSLALTPALLFHITMNSIFHTSSSTISCMIIWRSCWKWLCGFLAQLFYFVYFVSFKIPLNSRPLLPRALLPNRWRETSFSRFLRLLRRDGFSTCTLKKVQRRMKWGGQEMSDSHQNVAKNRPLFILQLILEPFYW